MRSSVFFDTLESRTLLSAAVAPLLPGVADDAPAIHASARFDLGAALQDLRALRQQLAEARQAVSAAVEALKDQLAPLREQLRDDLALVKADLKAARDVRNAHRPTILADIQAVRDARANDDQDALDAAKTKLAEDRQALKDELAPIHEQLKGHLELVKADRDAIADAIKNDESVQAAREKLEDLRAQLKAWFEEHFA